MTAPTRKPERDFTRRTDTDSICMRCFLTVRVKVPEELAKEERIHARECSHRPGMGVMEPPYVSNKRPTHL